MSTPIDAGAVDSGITYPGCLERPGVLFCDSFEAADPSFDHWDYATVTNGAVNRSQTRAKTGAWSLRATTTQGTSTQARMATKALDHQTSGEAWLRFYNWVPASVQVASNFSVGILSEVEFPYNGFEIRMSSTSVELNGTGIGVLASPTPTVFPRDRWVCVELHVTIDPVHGRYEAYLDGALVLQSAGLNTLPANGYSAAEVGVHYAPPSQGPVDVYVDDVFVARARIPCD